MAVSPLATAFTFAPPAAWTLPAPAAADVGASALAITVRFSGCETRAWREGEAFGFDDTIEHEAWNDSDQLRVVLIFDVWNPHLSVEEQELLVQFFASADATGHNPAAGARQT